ncbi:MAG: BNR repeat-containing protein [Verrucomicrobia bacterium]|nr:BNR repeat-containing protein [Verrucomicrobiota bacterium]
MGTQPHSQNSQSRRRVRFLWLAGLAAVVITGVAQDIERVTDVAPVWSGHPVGFHSLVASNRHFVAFYDADRRMTVAARRLPATNWNFVHLPEKVGWDSHNYITMALDKYGHLHLSGNMHGNPLVYFRSEQPLEITTLTRITGMTGQDEQRTTYPKFFENARGELVFTYRTGGSGNGNQIYNVYHPATQEWRRLLDQPLLDGKGQKSAYLNGPLRGPYGYFHLTWIWRETPDCATSHQICYARSRDLVNWETSSGKPLNLPMTFETGEVVDPVPMYGGAINGNVALGFDAQQRPIVSYHKFDTNGFTQVYNARLEDGEWKSYQATDWTYRWEFSGGGSIEFEVRVGAVTRNAEGRLEQRLSNKLHGSGTWMLDDSTLKLVGRAVVKPQYPSSLGKPVSTFPGMKVNLRPVVGDSRLWLRWETLGANRDRPRPGPLPPASLLQVYEIAPAGPDAAEAQADP